MSYGGHQAKVKMRSLTPRLISLVTPTISFNNIWDFIHCLFFSYLLVLFLALLVSLGPGEDMNKSWAGNVAEKFKSGLKSNGRCSHSISRPAAFHLRELSELRQKGSSHCYMRVPEAQLTPSWYCKVLWARLPWTPATTSVLWNADVAFCPKMLPLQALQARVWET